MALGWAAPPAACTHSPSGTALLRRQGGNASREQATHMWQAQDSPGGPQCGWERLWEWRARANLEEYSSETGKGFRQSCAPPANHCSREMHRTGDLSSTALSLVGPATPPPLHLPSFCPFGLSALQNRDRNQNAEQGAQTMGLRGRRFPSSLFKANSRANAMAQW